MRFRLRTLLIALAILPPILAPLGVWGWREYVAWRNARSTAPVAEPGYVGIVADDTPSIGQGVLVLEVRAGSPAEAGGLTAEDVIIAINNRRCRNLDDLDAALGQSAIGSKLMMQVTRGDKTQSLVVTLGKWRPPTNGPLTAP